MPRSTTTLLYYSTGPSTKTSTAPSMHFKDKPTEPFMYRRMKRPSLKVTILTVSSFRYHHAHRINPENNTCCGFEKTLRAQRGHITVFSIRFSNQCSWHNLFSVHLQVTVTSPVSSKPSTPPILSLRTPQQHFAGNRNSHIRASLLQVLTMVQRWACLGCFMRPRGQDRCQQQTGCHGEETQP